MKHNTILAFIVAVLLAFVLSISSHAQNIVRIDSVKWVGNWKAKITGTDINGNKCYLHYGFSSRTKQYIIPGQGLYVTTIPGRKREGYNRTKIILYNR